MLFVPSSVDPSFHASHFCTFINGRRRSEIDLPGLCRVEKSGVCLWKTGGVTKGLLSRGQFMQAEFDSFLEYHMVPWSWSWSDDGVL